MFRTHWPGKAVTMANQANSLSHTKWIASTTSCSLRSIGEKVIYSQYRNPSREIFRNLCRHKGVEIIRGAPDADHVRMPVSIPPKISVRVMGT